MFKTVTISFRTKRELLEWLDRISRESKCSRSSLIEAVLHNFLINKAGPDIQWENRVEIKGMEPPAGESEPPEGITYVTVGEVCVGLPKNRPCRISFDETQSIFKLDFAAGHDGGSGLVPASGKAEQRAEYSVKRTGTDRMPVPSTEYSK
jgi:hypothetical protein